MYLQGKSLESDILDSWKDKKGKFVKTFGMNTKRNMNEWRVTWDSIKENIHTALGMPGIAYEECNEAGCDLTHVEADTFEENVEKQKPFIKTKIVDYVLDEENESVDLIHEVTDDEFFDLLQSGEIKFVSPLIWPTNGGITINGTGRADLPIIDAYHWKYVHQAFLKSEPAFGDDTAQVKTMCEGEGCDVQLLAGQQQKPAMCGNCKFFVENNTCKLVKGEINYQDICDLYEYGETNPKDTKVNPIHEKSRVNYRHTIHSDMAATVSIGNQENISHLKETPLLYRHKGELHLVAASQCVKDIIQKKKESGITINDKELATAFSECGESNNAKSSFNTCTCDKRQKQMANEEQLQKDLKAEQDKTKELEAKLKAQDEQVNKEKSYEVKKGKYAKLFADTDDEAREKMVAKLKGMEDDDEHKAAQEVHEEMKSKKAGTEDSEKEDLKAQVTSMQAELSAPMISKLLKARSNKITKEKLKEYEKSLKAKTYTEIKEKYEEQKPLFAESITESTDDNTTNFDFNGGENSLAGKTFSEIEGETD